MACALLLCAIGVNADPIRYENAPLNISDGTTSVYPYQFNVPSGSLTDNSDGTATLNIDSEIYSNSGWTASTGQTVSTLNVGIGTTIPTRKLDVVGTATISGAVGLGTTTVTGNVFVSGNVGIGTTVPAYKIESTSGDIAFNTGGFISATGGTITTSGSKTIHTFNDSGTFTVSTATTVEYLVIGGGGGGGSLIAGGGGAGGYREGVLSIAAGTHDITVGAGGIAVTGGAAGVTGNDGNPSIFSTITSGGGGGGGTYNNVAGRNGGSAGGGGGAEGSGTGCSAAGGTASPAGQGNNGGCGGAKPSGVYQGGGGGGGAGAVGQAFQTVNGGNGGTGVTLSISGSPVCYAGGGGASATGVGTFGTATCGGGAGAVGGNSGTNGTANTGGGGGGVSGGTSGAGGKGVVIIRYLTQTPDTSSAMTLKSGKLGVGTGSQLSKVGVNGGVSVGSSYSGILAPTDGLIVQGNVGIGTAIPGATLQVGSGTISGTMASSSAHIQGDLEIDGTLYSGGTTFGFRVATAANQACTTTCVRGCVLGQDTAALTYAIVACSSAAADICLCSK